MNDTSQVAEQIARLRRALSSDVCPPGPRAPAAAVLVPLFETDGQLHVVYIRRSDGVAIHRGQVAFPGGRVDAADPSLLATALREAREEVGLEMESAEVLGALPAMTTVSTGIIVAPFVAIIRGVDRLKPYPREVAEIFHVSVAALRDPRNRGEYEWAKDGKPARRAPAILYQRFAIWGLTLKITLNLVEIFDER